MILAYAPHPERELAPPPTPEEYARVLESLRERAIAILVAIEEAPRPCLVCGEQFFQKPRGGEQKYCSGACRVAAYRARNGAPRVSKRAKRPAVVVPERVSFWTPWPSKINEKLSVPVEERETYWSRVQRGMA